MKKIYASLSPTLTQGYSARFINYLSLDRSKVESYVKEHNSKMQKFAEELGEEFNDPNIVVEIPLDEWVCIMMHEYKFGEEEWSSETE